MDKIIEILQSGEFYGSGKFTEIAKGKHELDYSWKTTKRKIKRLCLQKK